MGSQPLLPPSGPPHPILMSAPPEPPFPSPWYTPHACPPARLPAYRTSFLRPAAAAPIMAETCWDEVVDTLLAILEEISPCVADLITPPQRLAGAPSGFAAGARPEITPAPGGWEGGCWRGWGWGGGSRGLALAAGAVTATGTGGGVLQHRYQEDVCCCCVCGHHLSVRCWGSGCTSPCARQAEGGGPKQGPGVASMLLIILCTCPCPYHTNAQLFAYSINCTPSAA